MGNRDLALSPIEQQLLRFGMEQSEEVGLPAEIIREAINTGEANVPESGPISKETVLLEILETKARLPGVTVNEEEADLARQLRTAILDRVKSGMKSTNSNE